MYCLYFTYICPGAESNDYFHGTHSIDSDEMAQVSLLIWICTVYILPTSVLVLSRMITSQYPQYRFRWDGSSESSHLNMYCLYFTYICPGVESNDYFHGTHSIDSDEMAQVSLLIWICTVYILPTSVLVLSRMITSQYPQYRFRWDGSSESSHLNMYCLYFTYICPGVESNGYFHDTHSIDSDEMAQVNLLTWICTVYILPTSVLVLSLMIISTVPTV